MMRTFSLRLAFITVLGFLLSSDSTAQVSVNGGNQTMTISTGIAGGQPVSVLNTACSLSYQKQSKISKITVATSCPGQSFNLSVLATNVTRGTAAPEVSLENRGQEFILHSSIYGLLNVQSGQQH
jgi:hypothetical protein